MYYLNLKNWQVGEVLFLVQLWINIEFIISNWWMFNFCLLCWYM